MKKIEFFDPAMCCSSGVCGPAVDPELIRISSVVHNLKQKGYTVVRYNLSSETEAFINNAVVGKLLNEEGPDVLPIVLVDGEVVHRQQYPTNEELSAWTGMSEQELISKPRMRLELNVKAK
ncbi:arsenite efflux transporter metallochaperone ArsD [Saccharibacillus qingshengii]|uniref:arsenite efflux transporter metallochaperone ArsD n=1 Tax=Saccharibacillus qingshengii TaxID=1763540 RepID=UPI0015578B8A|nr:arsenite efflux transporter metallochaperone ArsD [Saccharibacillus qingshengii]